MNVDTLSTIDSIGAVITNLQINNIDIAGIQETHNGRNGHIERERTTQSSLAGNMATGNQNSK